MQVKPPDFILRRLPYEKAIALGYQPKLLKDGGIVVGIQKQGKKESIYYVDDDIHTLCIGATRSGKSRTVVLQSIGLQGLSGESMVVSDPKGELMQYTAPFLKRLGYEVIILDFKNPLKSSCYNFLQNVVDAVNDGDMSRAIDFTWDITTALVGEPKGEPIWNHGEASVIAAAIITVVVENKGHPEYQNMTNVFYFISEMCRMAGTDLPINRYMKTLPSDHPAKGLLGISEVAPSKTRGSFFTAALTTLRLFTNPLIYEMTCKTDFDVTMTGSEKRAIFIVLPDEKVTYYSLASLFVCQHYETLVNVADNRGGRLKNRVNFNLDELGNFTTIPAFANKLTVGGGRGIRFNLFLQSFAQLDEKYNKETAITIKSNCQVWIYLQADDNETLEAISKKLGNYTVASNSQSSSFNKRDGASNTSTSTNLCSRALLTMDEVRLINRPHSLVTSRDYPAMMTAPDLSACYFNKMFGLGDKEHNRRVREEREARRPERKSTLQMKLWGIWDKYNGSAREVRAEHADRPERGQIMRERMLKNNEKSETDTQNN